MMFIIVLLALFGIKHFVCDFVLQTGHMVKDKGIYLGSGGVMHAAHHATGTFIVLMIILPWNWAGFFAAIVFGCLDGFVHYHIDFVKTRLAQGITPADHKFWVLLGADQGLHYLTYLAIIAIIII